MWRGAHTGGVKASSTAGRHIVQLKVYIYLFVQCIIVPAPPRSPFRQLPTNMVDFNNPIKIEESKCEYTLRP